MTEGAISAGVVNAVRADALRRSRRYGRSECRGEEGGEGTHLLLALVIFDL